MPAMTEAPNLVVPESDSKPTSDIDQENCVQTKSQKKNHEACDEKNDNIDESSENIATVYLTGPRLYLITAALCTSLFLTNLEIPIVTTSIISITGDLHEFNQSSWLISSYMLGYVSMLIIWAKVSDIFGRKIFAVTAIAIFTIFSGACGAAQSMTQLISLRAFQGLGGGGNFALGSVVFMELVPPEAYPKYMSMVSSVFSLSLMLGPIFGGALNHSERWRWVFLINVPAGALSAVTLLLCVPAEFPHQKGSTEGRKIISLFSKEMFRRVDFIGAALLMIATTLLVAALQEAGQSFAWDSAFVISFLTISGLSWIAFVFWERNVTLKSSMTEPVFPWRLMTSRIWAGMILNALFLGAPWFVTIFQLPQRFQVVNGASALSAGIRLIPFTVAAPIGSIVSSILAGKAKIPPIYLVIGASSLQVIGFALLSTLPLSNKTSAAQYGYQVVAGFGVGINISTLILMTPYSVDEGRDQAVALGSVTQFRIMGGVIGLAIVTAAYKANVISSLDQFLTLEQRSRILQTPQTIASFDSIAKEKIERAFASGYNLQFRILIGFAAAQIPSSLLMWQRKQIVV